MLRKVLLPLTLLFYLFNLSAQEESNVKLKIEAGYLALTASENLGLFLNVEPKLRSSKNTFIGLRVGLVINPQQFENHDRSQFMIYEEFDNGGVSFVPTFDYYFTNITARPYLGVGLGYYFLSGNVDVSRTVILNPTEDVFEANVDKQIGFLLRGGFDLGKFIVGVEYNFIQKGDIEIPDGQIIGTVNNSYLGLSVGLVIGGQKSLN